MSWSFRGPAWGAQRSELERAEAKSLALTDIYGQSRDAIAAKLKLYEPLLIPDDFANVQAQQLSAIVADVIERLRGSSAQETQTSVGELHKTYLEALNAMEAGLSAYRAATLAAQRGQEALKTEQRPWPDAEAASSIGSSTPKQR